jgi:hypothetical protein
MENGKYVRVVILLSTLMVMPLVFTEITEGNQWIYFQDKEIIGYVVDAETSKPIENSIVVAMWQLVQMLSEGFGGYAKIQIAITDSKGNFVIPSWKTIKPLNLNSVMHELAPEIIIYKPGYKLYHSHKVEREGFPDDYSKTEEEKKRIKDKASLTPAKLKRIYSDEERAKNLERFETESRLFELIENLSKKEAIILIKTVKDEYLSLSQDRKARFKYIEQIEDQLSRRQK